MPITLVVTPSSVSANAYADVAYADAYFGSRSGPDAASWVASVDEEKKKQCLITATNRIDQENYEGYSTTTAQRLLFPRVGIYTSDLQYSEGRRYVDETTIPRRVAEATCEQALAEFMASGDRTRLDPLAKFQSLSVAGISMQLRDSSAPAADVIVPIAGRLLAPFFSAVGFTRLERA